MAGQNWGCVENFRYRCCFICVDASLPVLDQYVEERVDVMVDCGLLNEVCDMYNMNADYTRGLRQAIGVREFQNFLRVYLSEVGHAGVNGSDSGFMYLEPADKVNQELEENMKEILRSATENQLKVLLEGAIDNVKANTRRLVRRQASTFCQNIIEHLVFSYRIDHMSQTGNEQFLTINVG